MVCCVLHRVFTGTKESRDHERVRNSCRHTLTPWFEELRANELMVLIFLYVFKQLR